MNNNMIKPAFTPSRSDDERIKDKSFTFTIRINKEEQERIEWVMNFLQEDQKSKAFKQCFEIGFNVLHEDKIGAIRDVILGNVVNNGRKGISVIDGKIGRL